LPDLIGINISAFTAAIMALGICSSGYVTEIVRGGINSIAVGQWEAAYTLGYTQGQTVRYIIVPRMLRIVLPALSNELEALLKSTAILSTIGWMELTKVGTTLVARYMIPMPAYVTIACLYLLLSATLKIAINGIEKHMLH
jgi:polar amino acid transport system permease protein